ncbi:MAG: AsmA-like C-terminal region-containing protein, partial [Hyphomonadaceae bacterium]
VIGGRLTDITIRGDITPDDIARGHLRDEALNIAFNFDGANFRFIDTMSPVSAGRGRAVLQGNRFDLWMDDARLEGLVVSQGQVELPRLSPRGAMSVIRARAQGDARGVVTLLRQEPIGLEGRLPVQPETVVGTGAIALELQRPMLSDVPFEDLRFTVTGDFTGVGGMERDGRLRFADGRLTVRGDHRAVTISGPVRAGDSNTQIQWVETMTRGTATPSRYQISGDFDANDLQRLGYPVAEVAQGRIGVTLAGAGRGYEVDNATVTLDMRNASVALPRNLWTKRAGQAGSARFNVARNDDGGLTLSAIELRGPGMNAAQGEVRISRADQFQRATFPRVQIDGRSDARINIERATDGAYVYDVSGAFFDATLWMDEDPQAAARAQQAANAAARPAPAPIRGRVRVDRLGMRQNTNLANARVEFSVVNDALIMLTAQGNDPQGGSLTFGLGPRPDNPQGRITLRGDDAGFAARALAGSENVNGGTVTADGTWQPSPMRAQFTVRMRDFTAVRVPAMTRLLGSVASLRGLADMLGGDGITFTQMEAPVVMTPGRIQIGESRASGPSLGITATGSYDTRRDNLDIDGVVVPSYGLNSMLGNVPVIGDLFRSREGEGLFGMTYSMNGPIANARVTVNPLSALTPGIFRRIFEPVQRNRPAQPAQPAQNR